MFGILANVNLNKIKEGYTYIEFKFLILRPSIKIPNSFKNALSLNFYLLEINFIKKAKGYIIRIDPINIHCVSIYI